MSLADVQAALALTPDEWRAQPYRPNGRHELAHLPMQLPAEAIDHQIAELITPGRRLIGADTIREAIGLLPDGLDTYSSYVDNFRGILELIARFGHTAAILFSFTIFGNPANCADIEPGAMHPSDVPHFLDHLAVPIPGAALGSMLYYSAGIANEVIAAAGQREFIRLSAHYGAGEHICEPGVCGFPFAHGTQWDDAGPAPQRLNFDRQLWRPGVLDAGRQLPPPLPKGVDPSMVTIAMSADGDIVALCETQPSGPGKTGEVFALRTTAAWNGKDGIPWHGVQGQTSHLWESLGIPKP